MGKCRSTLDDLDLIRLDLTLKVKRQGHQKCWQYCTLLIFYYP